jgi:hypothetical protein
MRICSTAKGYGGSRLHDTKKSNPQPRKAPFRYVRLRSGTTFAP